MRVLSYNCLAGISGDMNLGAMIDLGVDSEVLKSQLRLLPLEGWDLHWEKDVRQGIGGTRCDVWIGNHSSDSREVHGHGDKHSHHDHPQGGCHRTFLEISRMIEQSGLREAVKFDAIQVFRVLAEAEGAVHGKPVEEVHFHEVGAVDSIIDIVGAAVCWNLLGIDRVIASTIELGGGTVRCAHGRMPVPAPATARLVESMPVSVNATDKEATTPTGAALLRGKGCRFHEKLEGRQVKAGTGIGQRDDPNLPNVLHVALLEVGENGSLTETSVWEVSVNLDDMTPEHVAYLCEQIQEAGALDVWQVPATFKKGRVGVIVSALSPAGNLASVETALLRHSRSLGLRKRPWDRVVLDRSTETLETSLGSVRLKIAHAGDGSVIRCKPEFEDCKRLAREHEIPLSEVIGIVNEVLSLRRDSV